MRRHLVTPSLALLVLVSTLSAGACSEGPATADDGEGGEGGVGPEQSGGQTSGGSGGADSGGSGGDGAGGSSGGSGGAGQTGGGPGGGGTASSGGGNAGSGGTPTGGASSGGSGNDTLLTFAVLSAGLLDGASTDWEQARDVAVDDAGNVYVVGGTSSPDFPVTVGAYDTTYNTGGSQLGSRGQTDGFVTKLDPTGAILWSTYLGSPNYDRIYAVEVDSAHDVYVAGRAGSGFPTTAGVHQETFAGDSSPSSAYGSQDGFVAKLSADGSTLLWSTYFGEAGQGFVRDIDVDAAGKVHVAASSVSGADLSTKITSGAVQSTLSGTCDSFYARLSADGSTIEYGTLLGGNDSGYYSSNPAVRVRDDGAVFFLAGEPGAGAPTTTGAFQTAPGGADDFLLARFDSDDTMAFCTYLGGSGNESLDTHSLAIDPDGNPVIAAATVSTDYPVTDGTTAQGSRDVVVTILSEDGDSLVASTQIGGSGADGGEGVGVDAAGNVYVTGFTNSTDLPVTTGALEATPVGSLEGLLLVLSPGLGAVRYLSYDGITAEYGNRSSIVTPAGQWAVVGAVWQLSPFPATSGNDGQIDGTHAAFFRLLELAASP